MAPATIPIRDAQTRHAADPFSSSPTITTKVTSMHTGPAAAGASLGTSFALPNTTGMTVITSRINTVPLKAGVTSFLSRDRRRERRT